MKNLGVHKKLGAFLGRTADSKDQRDILHHVASWSPYKAGKIRRKERGVQADSVCLPK